MPANKLVKDAMTTDVELANPDTNITHIALLMKEQDCGSIPVVEAERLIGFITDRDIVLRCVAADKDPVMALAKDIMTDKILYCFDTDTLEQAAENMARNQVRRLPVITKEKKLVGIISLGDISKAGCDCHKAMSRIAA